MANCTKCGSELKPNAKYCGKCGTLVSEMGTAGAPAGCFTPGPAGSGSSGSPADSTVVTYTPGGSHTGTSAGSGYTGGAYAGGGYTGGAAVPTAESYFDGGLLQKIGWTLLGWLLTTVTLGICLPFAFCMIYRWEACHTVIGGRRLRFDGTGGQLMGKWLLWMLLTVITLGIYGLWVTIKLKQWQVKHTHFAD